MKKILLGIIAINLTFISALALSSVGAVQAQSEGDVNVYQPPAPLPIRPDPEDSGEDLNEIDADTTGSITATVSGDAEDSEEGEDPR